MVVVMLLMLFMGVSPKEAKVSPEVTVRRRLNNGGTGLFPGSFGGIPNKRLNMA